MEKCEHCTENDITEETWCNEFDIPCNGYDKNCPEHTDFKEDK